MAEHIDELLKGVQGEAQPAMLYERNPKQDKPKEAVNHPDHYGGKDNPYEVIKVLEAWLSRDEMIGFLKGNSIKYHARASRKGKREEDSAKAAWYDNYLVEYM
jgi:hypothetical protein